ncbi:MAG: Gfo/Idh/MocA family protein [Phycisphaerales bacterium]
MGKRGTSKPRIGIVGFGRIAELWHTPGLRKAGWSIEAALDVTPARREVARGLGIPRVVDSLKALLEIELDAALVATHSSVRRRVIAPLARAGLPLLVEKPLAMTGREAESICRVCEEAGVPLSVFHNRRFDPDMLRVQRLVESGFLGEIFQVEDRLFEREPATRFGAAEFHQAWRVTASMGGGSMLDWGPHLVDQALTLYECAGAGRVVSVTGDLRHVRWGDADDHFMATLVFESGARALVGKSDVAPIGPPHKWVVVGSEGSLVADWDRAEARNARGRTKRVESKPRAASIHRNFREAIEGRAELLVTGRESLRVNRVFDAVRRSAANHGRSVRTNI